MGVQKAWGGRFQETTDELVEQFTASIAADVRLAEHDIAASIAHAEMLAHVGILSPEEAAALRRELEAIRTEIRAGTFAFDPKHEDIHLNIEAALVERLGDVGRKLHTARSRNDQVVTAFRLWIRDAIDRLTEQLGELQRAYVRLAHRWPDLVLPGYTHLQPAQPILLGHYCLAYVEQLDRDRERLMDCRKRVNQLPLGAAALAGTSLPIDREYVRRKLGFERVLENALDAVTDRDFALEYLSCLIQIALHLSHWAEDWIIWSSPSWGFLELPDRYCTGSSIMPQKKNPDVLELIRGRTGRLLAAFVSLGVMLKGLPTGYNRDLQEDKPPVFEATDLVAGSLKLAARVIPEVRFRTERIRALLEKDFLDATSLMEYLIAKGLPMRTAHELVGRLVRECLDQGRTLPEVPLEELHRLCPLVDKDVFQVLGVDQAVRAFRSHGSTNPEFVAQRLRHWASQLGL
jgi:argininosuccinate lyase